jgi:outer membrane protein assembly factor BamB
MGTKSKSFALVFVALFLTSLIVLPFVSVKGQVLTPTQLWETNISWTMTEGSKTRDWTEPAVVNGSVYVGARSDVYVDRYHSYVWINVYAFNATNGEELWNYKDDACEQISSPSVVNGVVYFATDRYICALNASNGSLLWNYSTGSFYSVPFVVQDSLFVNIYGNLLALNSNNGHVIWNYTNSNLFTSPVIANGIVYVSSFDENTYAFNATTGDKIWNYTAGAGVPAVADGVVCAGSEGGHVYALNAATGAKLWSYDTTPANYQWMRKLWMPWSASASSPHVENGEVFLTAHLLPVDPAYTTPGETYRIVGDGWTWVFALNAANGNKIWQTTIGSDAIGASVPVIDNGIIYIGTQPSLYALNEHNGEILWNYSIGFWFSSPVLVNGVAYVGAKDSQVYAITFPAIPPKEPFPTVPVAVVSGASAIVVAACLLIYFKKKRNAGDISTRVGVQIPPGPLQHRKLNTPVLLKKVL